MRKIPVAQPTLGKSEWQNLKSCLESSWISSQGKFIERFEQQFANYCGVKYAISTSSGTAALHLALLALGIGKGDEVILPALTFVSCANAIVYTGAKPVFADVEGDTWTIDPKDVEKKITNKTKAIMAVHLYGYPADMKSLKSLARKYGIFLIEDASEAHGAKFAGKRVGSMGKINCFSFYGNKIITTGEGGMITTNNKSYANKITLLKNHGADPKRRYWHPVIGYNYRMTNLQAAIGLAQLEKLDYFLAKRKKIAKLYRKFLKSIPGVVLPPEDTNNRQAVCWQFSILITKKFPLNRDHLIRLLAKKGIETRPFFVILTDLPMYKQKEPLPVAEKISQQGISLPTSVNLTEKEIKYICEQIKKAS